MKLNIKSLLKKDKKSASNNAEKFVPSKGLKKDQTGFAYKSRVGVLTGSAFSIAGIVLMVFTAATYIKANQEYEAKIQTATGLVALSGSVSKNALGAVRGESVGLEGLETDNTKFTQSLNKFIGVGSNWSLSEGAVKNKYQDLTNEWNKTNQNVMSILEKRGELKNLKTRLAKAEEDLDKISKQVSRFAQESEGIMSPVEEQQARVWLESVRQILSNAVSLQGRDEVSPELSFRIVKNLAYFNEILNKFEKGFAEEEIKAAVKPEQKAVIAEIKKLLKEGGAEENLNLLAKSMDSVQEAKLESGEINKEYANLLAKVNGFLEEIKVLNQAVTVQWAVTFLGSLLLVAFGIAFILIVNARKEKAVAKERARENQQNIDSVHLLLNEIEGLGSGDLTKRATPNNGVTHEIALALNATVEELRRLVSSVRSTTIDVTSMALQTGEQSGTLAKQTVKQEAEIQEVSNMMSKISQELDEVARVTSQSSDLAASALDLSQRGEVVVKSTIDGMNSIRETIQETAKRIKSLGESSQEIGQVTRLIRQVGSKIQVLALNAAIQSADAGEAGKGFAVVAEEVQALADEAAASAQKIDRLVQNIQSSAKEAISTMEVATKRVVEGTTTADNAGDALRQIGQAAKNLRTLVDEVTTQMQEESEKTTDLVFKMTEVKQFTKSTRTSVDQFQQQISQMSDQTKVLKTSVDGFRLDAQ